MALSLKISENIQHLLASVKSLGMLFLISSSVVSAQVDPNILMHGVEKVELPGFQNLHKVNTILYRSEQPKKREMLLLEKQGIKTIFNLRRTKNNKRKVRKTSLESHKYGIYTKKINQLDILNTLRIIQESEKPILIHCLHGSDRTGAVVAAYRMVFENWEREDALAEFLNETYGFHPFWFPNIENLLTSIDIGFLQKELMKK